MGRRLANIALIAAAGFASSAQGLSLGGLQASSALNEPLLARIPLRSVGDVEPGRIKVELAPPEAFERAGVERVFSLTRLQFEVVREGGQSFVEVSTSAPVKEPFLDFLVEINWPQGRLQREYTVLLDPPTFDTGTQFAEGAGSTGGSSSGAEEAAVAAVPAATPEVSEAATTTGETYGPVSPNETLYAIASQVRPDGNVTVNQVMLALLRANPDAFEGGNINRLNRGAILRVPERAEMTRLSGADATAEVLAQTERWQSARQVAIGDTEAQTPAGEAAAETAAGEAAGAASGTMPTSVEAESPPAVETAEAGDDAPAPDGEASQPVADAADTQTAEAAAGGGDASAPSGELRVVAPEESGGETAGISETAQAASATGERIAAVESRLTMMEEANASLESENRDLKSQVEGLKQELANMQRMLNIELNGGNVAAELAGSADGNTAGASQTDDNGQTPAGRKGQAAEADMPSAAELEQAITQASGEAMASSDAAGGSQGLLPKPEGRRASTAGGELNGVVVAGSGARTAGRDSGRPENQAGATQSGGKPAEETPVDDNANAVTAGVAAQSGGEGGSDQAAGDAVAAAVAGAEESADAGGADTQPDTADAEQVAGESQQPADTTLATLMAQLTQRWELAAGAGGALLLILVLLMVRQRRRRESDEALELDEAMELAPAAAGAPGARPMSGEDQAEEDDSFALRPADGRGGQALEEAERHIAYGNYEQAQEVLDDALGEDPDNRDIRFKLLQVLVKRGDRGGFEAEAQVLHTQIRRNDDPLWQSTLAMGREIAPQHPLFAESTAGADDASVAERSESAQPDASEAWASSASEGAADDAAAPPVGGDTQPLEEPTASPEESDHREAASDAVGEGDEEDDLAFDFTWENDYQAVAEHSTVRSASGSESGYAAVHESYDGGGGARDDFGALEFELPADREPSSDTKGDARPAGAEADPEAGEPDLSDGRLWSGQTDQEPRDAAGASAEVPEEDYDALDEVGTKLDLARAYIDMGDEEGARGLLEEVIHEGDDTQKDEARNLMREAG